jgi:hypothetical protein
MAEQTNIPAARIVLPGALKPVAIGLVVVAVVAVGLFMFTRGAAPSTTTASAAPPPVATPNPHLTSPATAQQVFNGLGHAGLKVTAHTASAGAANSGVVTKIFATYLGWPLDVTQFSSADALADEESWASGASPVKGDPPVTIVGGNILVIWGPINAGRTPVGLDERQKAGLQPLVNALDALLSPLRTRTNAPVIVAETAPPVATASAAPSAAPSVKPSAKPSSKPKPKPTPKP